MRNANGQLSNPALVQAMLELRESDIPTTRAKALDALKRSVLIIAMGPETDASGVVTDPVTIMSLVGPQGKDVPTFTDVDAVRRWKLASRVQSVLGLRAPGVCVHAQGINAETVSINPDGPIGMVLGRAEIAMLASYVVPALEDQGPTWMNIERDEYLSLGHPIESLPEAVVIDLHRALEACPEVDRAFLFQASVGDESPVALGLTFVNKPTQSSLDKVGRAIGPALQGRMQGPFMDMVVLQGNLLRSVEAQVTPFFKRRRSTRWPPWRRST